MEHWNLKEQCSQPKCSSHTKKTTNSYSKYKCKGPGIQSWELIWGTFWILFFMTFLTSVGNHIAVGALILLQGKPRKMVIVAILMGQPGKMKAWHDLDRVDIFPFVHQVVRRPSVWNWTILIMIMMFTMIVTTPKIKMIGIGRYVMVYDIWF